MYDHKYPYSRLYICLDEPQDKGTHVSLWIGKPIILYCVFKYNICVTPVTWLRYDNNISQIICDKEKFVLRVQVQVLSIL